MPITVVSVAKSYSNRGNHVHRPGTKKRWYLYFIDEEGNFRTKRINLLEALYYKGRQVHRYKIACPYCDGLSLAHVRSLKGEVECPYCAEMIDLARNYNSLVRDLRYKPFLKVLLACKRVASTFQT